MPAMTKTDNGITKKPRKLKVLTPLIRAELTAGFEAGRRHWQEVGRLLNEAREHFPKSGPSPKGQTWGAWVKANFVHPWSGNPLHEDTARRWMLAAKRVGSGRPRRELKSYVDSRSPGHANHNPKLDWQSGVREVQQKLNLDALSQRWDDERREERELEALARKIIDAGYRALAAVVHPDKPNGSTQAMSKLNKAKRWLLDQI